MILNPQRQQSMTTAAGACIVNPNVSCMEVTYASWQIRRGSNDTDGGQGQSVTAASELAALATLSLQCKKNTDTASTHRQVKSTISHHYSSIITSLNVSLCIHTPSLYEIYFSSHFTTASRHKYKKMHINILADQVRKLPA